MNEREKEIEHHSFLLVGEANHVLMFFILTP